MDVQIMPVERDHKSVLRQLLELYQHDFSEYDSADVNEHGTYGYEYLDHYWTEADRYPFFIRVDGRLAGFVLINNFCALLQAPAARSVAEFFVMRKYRRQGVGRRAALQVFDRFPGQWEVRQQKGNYPSYVFWEKVIGEYTAGQYDKGGVVTEGWEGQAITFDNSK